jgi:hypothetical protein
MNNFRGPGSSRIDLMVTTTIAFAADQTSLLH